MNIIFEDEALREIYERGFTKDKKYSKYCRDKKFVSRFIEQVNSIRGTIEYEDLFKLSFLHYERLRHEYAGLSSFRVSNKYVERVICREREDCIEIIILELDNTHYGNKK